MISVLNIRLPLKRNFKSSIRAIYGIGLSRALKLSSLIGLHPQTKIEAVAKNKLKKLGVVIEKSFLTDFELKRKITLNINLLKNLKTLRGFCHFYGLPTRGQRTHTNASTQKRLKKVVVAAAPNKFSKVKGKQAKSASSMKKMKSKQKSKKK